jgi:hypothetical protein
MYAFRKPFSTGIYEGYTLWNMDYKILLIIAQVLGYMTSKFIGIRVVSAMNPGNRGKYIILFILLAEFSLFLFAVAPFPYGIIFLFLNGLPLGMIWGIVFSYLEGRKVTEILAAGLSASFILSSGAVKATGKWLILNLSVPEVWMPFVTGLIYLPPLLIGIWMLNKIPPPDPDEKRMRSERVPMSRADRKKLFIDLGGSLFFLIIVYCYLTAYRDFRDNFASDMWLELGYADSSNIFTLTEIPVALCVLIALGALCKIKNNWHAFLANYFLITAGILLIWISSLLMKLNPISPVVWSILTGIGVYLAYVPFGSMLFERMIAILRYRSNAGFLIYIADSAGYLGSIAVLLLKNFFAVNISAYNFIVRFAVIAGILPVVILVISGILFKRKMNKLAVRSSIQAGHRRTDHS